MDASQRAGLGQLFEMLESAMTGPERNEDEAEGKRIRDLRQQVDTLLDDLKAPADDIARALLGHRKSANLFWLVIHPLERLFERGVDPSLQANASGLTMADLAAIWGADAFLLKLLDSGVDVNYVNKLNGMSLLHLLVARDGWERVNKTTPDTVKYLLTNYNPDVLCKDYENTQTPLQLLQRAISDGVCQPFVPGEAMPTLWETFRLLQEASSGATTGEKAHNCVMCFSEYSTASDMKHCGRCLSVWYCNSQCKEEHLELHKHACKEVYHDPPASKAPSTPEKRKNTSSSKVYGVTKKVLRALHLTKNREQTYSPAKGCSPANRSRDDSNEFSRVPLGDV